MFLRVDQLAQCTLYKFNGVNWIEVDKALSDQHAYDDAYIDHLIEKISSGEYDPDLLSDAERDRIEEKLTIQINNMTDQLTALFILWQTQRSSGKVNSESSGGHL
jgi:hypothetical protein